MAVVFFAIYKVRYANWISELNIHISTALVYARYFILHNNLSSILHYVTQSLSRPMTVLSTCMTITSSTITSSNSPMTLLVALLKEGQRSSSYSANRIVQRWDQNDLILNILKNGGARL